MDKRRTIVASAVAMLVVLGYLWLNAWVRTKYPEYFPPPQQEVAKAEVPATAPATAPAATLASTGPSEPATAPSTSSADATTAPSVPTLTAGLQVLNPPPTPEGTGIGSLNRNDPNWPVHLNVSPLGAGLEEVILNGYYHAADYRKPEKERRMYSFQEPYPEYPDTRPLATRWIEVNGTRVNTAWTAWKREGDPQIHDDWRSVTYSLTIGQPQGGGVLKVWKTYTLHARPKHPGLGYEVMVDYRLENLTQSPLTVKSGFYGPTMPPRESTRPPDRQVMAGFNGNGDVVVEGHAIEGFTHKKSVYDLTKNEGGLPALWFGPASVYFNAFVRPTHPQYVTNVLAVGMHLHDEKDLTYRPEDRPVVTTFETTAVTVSPGQPASVPLNVYFGPRDRKVLRSEYYAAAPREYNDSLVLKVGPCSFCTWLWLIDGLVAMLQGFQWLMGGFAGRGDWGLAIILLVGVVRLCLHPITKRSQVQMMKMGKFGPEIEKLKKKYGDDKEGLNKAMIGFYREHGFGLGPVLGCAPMFLQMPIWIALYSALQTTFELRQEPFLWGFTWIKDLSKPDYLIKFGQPFTLFFEFLTFDGLNILPILMGVVFWFNHKYTPKPAAMTPEQEQQQKMMQWMTLLFPLFLYNGPSGLNLYILTSTFIGIIEAKVIRKHIKEREEAEKAGIVIVDAGRPTRAARRRKEGEAEPPKKGGIMGWVAELQEKVEQARREQQDRGGKRKA